MVFCGGRVLVLRWPQRDEVRLPKGHVEPGETVEQAALRETAEESGYVDLEIVADLGCQGVRFEDEERRVERVERYFLMALRGDMEAPRRRGETKFDPEWLTWDEALKKLTFRAEKEWVRRAKCLMTGGEIVGEERGGSS